MKKSFQRSGRILGSKNETVSRAFCPKPSPTVCATEFTVYCCAATRFHRDGGDGRLLAAFDVLAGDERHELPQKQRRAPDEHARFRNNMTTLMRTKDMNETILYVIKKNTVKKYLVMLSNDTGWKEHTDREKEVLNDIYYVIEEIIDTVSSSLSWSICAKRILWSGTWWEPWMKTRYTRSRTSTERC